MSRYLIILLAFLTHTLDAQSTSDYFSTGSMSMGGNLATMSGADALFGNQAGCASIDGLIADASVLQKFSINSLQKMSLGLAYPVGSGAVGFSISRIGFASLSEQKIGVFYARQLGSNLSISAQGDWIALNIDEYGSNNILTLEIGIQSKISKQLTLGAHIYSPGELEIAPNNSIPSSLEIACSYQPSDKFIVHFGGRKIIDRPIEFIFGMDYQLHQKLNIRLGGNTAVNEFTSGVVIKAIKDFDILFGFAYHNVLGGSPGVGLQYGSRTL